MGGGGIDFAKNCEGGGDKFGISKYNMIRLLLENSLNSIGVLDIPTLLYFHDILVSVS